VTLLKQLGFHYVFDTNFGADLMIVEEATEFVS
jgi:iron only hydrogenase large subunit-like protein